MPTGNPYVSDSNSCNSSCLAAPPIKSRLERRQSDKRNQRRWVFDRMCECEHRDPERQASRQPTMRPWQTTSVWVLATIGYTALIVNVALMLRGDRGSASPSVEYSDGRQDCMRTETLNGSIRVHCWNPATLPRSKFAVVE